MVIVEIPGHRFDEATEILWTTYNGSVNALYCSTPYPETKAGQAVFQRWLADSRRSPIPI